MANDFIFKHSSAGYVALMKSGATQQVLHTYADPIAANAQAHLAPDSSPQRNAPYIVSDFMGYDRAGVRITTGNPHAMAAELKYSPLKDAAGV